MLFIKQKYKQQCCFLAHKGEWFSKISNTRQPIRNTRTHKQRVYKWRSWFWGHKIFIRGSFVISCVHSCVRESERAQSQVQKSSRKCKLLEMCCLSPLEVNTKSLSGRHIVIDKELCKAGKKKICHLRCQDFVQNILSFACLFDEHLPPARLWLD